MMNIFAKYIFLFLDGVISLKYITDDISLSMTYTIIIFIDSNERF